MRRKSFCIGVLLVTCMMFHSSIAASYIGVSKGLVYQAYVDYNDSDTVTITAGYGECNGHYWEITSPVAHDMTSLVAAEGFHYLYIDDANSSFPIPTVIDRSTEPAWSDSKLGWYNANDRCIGVVWNKGTGAICKFTANSDMEYINEPNALKVVLNYNGAVTGNWTSVETTAYTPVNTIAIRVHGSNSDGDGSVEARIRSYENSATQLVGSSSYGSASIDGWIPISRNSSRDLMYKGLPGDDQTFYLGICGYKIER